MCIYSFDNYSVTARKADADENAQIEGSFFFADIEKF